MPNSLPATPVWSPPPPPHRSTAPAQRKDGSVVVVRAAATAVLGGFLIGVVTQLLQGELPGSWNVLANSGVTWAIAAAAVGMLMPTGRSAALGGAASMVAASVSYYWAVEWFEGAASDARSSIIWSAAGIVAGAAFGAAGWWVRYDAVRRWLALALVAGVLVGEGRHIVQLSEGLRPAGAVQVVVGVALAVLCVRRARQPLAALALVAAGAVCYVVGMQAIDAAFLAPL